MTEMLYPAYKISAPFHISDIFDEFRKEIRQINRSQIIQQIKSCVQSATDTKISNYNITKLDDNMDAENEAICKFVFDDNLKNGESFSHADWLRRETTKLMHRRFELERREEAFVKKMSGISNTSDAHKQDSKV